MSKYIQTPERVKSCLKACEDFADPVSAVRNNFAFGTDMANTVNRLRAQEAGIKLNTPMAETAGRECVRLQGVNTELLAALQAIHAGFMDKSIIWARPRRADSDPYHPANVLMTAALTKATS